MPATLVVPVVLPNDPKPELNPAPNRLTPNEVLPNVPLEAVVLLAVLNVLAVLNGLAATVFCPKALLVLGAPKALTAVVVLPNPNPDVFATEVGLFPNKLVPAPDAGVVEPNRPPVPAVPNVFVAVCCPNMLPVLAGVLPLLKLKFIIEMRRGVEAMEGRKEGREDRRARTNKDTGKAIQDVKTNKQEDFVDQFEKDETD